MDTTAIKEVLLAKNTIWYTHDLGMIFTDVESGHIHVWDSALKSPVVPIHTHPWYLDSKIIVGELQNIRYAENCCSGQPFKMVLAHWASRKSPRPSFPLSEIKNVKLVVDASETFKAGAVYRMNPDEIHSSNAIDGTVTFVTLKYAGRSTSRLYFQGAFTPMEKRRATYDEILRALALVSINQL